MEWRRGARDIAPLGRPQGWRQVRFPPELWIVGLGCNRAGSNAGQRFLVAGLGVLDDRHTDLIGDEGSLLRRDAGLWRRRAREAEQRRDVFPAGLPTRTGPGCAACTACRPARTMSAASGRDDARRHSLPVC